MGQTPHHATGSNMLPLVNPRITFNTPTLPSVPVSVPVDEQMTIEFSTSEEPMQVPTSSGFSVQELAPVSISATASTPQLQISPPYYPIDPSRLLLLCLGEKQPELDSNPAAQLRTPPRSVRKALHIRLDPESSVEIAGAETEMEQLQAKEQRRKREEAKRMDSLLKSLDKCLRFDDLAPASGVAKLQNMGRARARKVRARAVAAAATAVASAAVITDQEMMDTEVAGKEEKQSGRQRKEKTRGMPISQKTARRLRKHVEEAKASGAEVGELEISFQEGKMLSRNQAQRLRKKIRIAVGKATGRVAKTDRAGMDRAGKVENVADQDMREGDADMMDVV